jgi:hypothetical protein
VTAIDWQQIFAERLLRGEPTVVTSWELGDADIILATRVPQACPTCGGSGIKMFPAPILGVDCPDCPTVAKLLAIGAAVMTLDEDSFSSEPFWYDIIDRLRAVEP